MLSFFLFYFFFYCKETKRTCFHKRSLINCNIGLSLVHVCMYVCICVFICIYLKGKNPLMRELFNRSMGPFVVNPTPSNSLTPHEFVLTII